jgi:hypothetical protein
MKTQQQDNSRALLNHPPRTRSGAAFTCFCAALLISLVANAQDFCKTTSRAAGLACRSEALSDYQVALGNCANLSDPVARKACQTQAKADYKSALEDCKDQLDARQAVCARLGGAPYDPLIAPSNFVSNVTNPFFPLTPGTTYYFLGGGESNVVFVTHNTKVILGVTCVEVRDVVYVNGALEEDTLDWYAQDKTGNVWYFGENSKQYAGGLIVGVEGSFIAGENNAKPGLIMKAAPAIGDFYRQEFLLTDAEDIAEVTGLTETVTVPRGVFTNCLKTQETSPLEPDALENKFYATGIGNILTVDVATGARLELVNVTSGN